MKTILYQPLFINPQAYFVFPQLYHIKNCIFKNGKENVSDVSWHFVDNANCKFTITGNRFNYKFSFDSDVTKCNVLFTNNSHKEDNIFANATVVQFNNVKE